MVDAVALLLSHSFLIYLVWKLMSLRDPEDQGVIRHVPDKKKLRR